MIKFSFAFSLFSVICRAVSEDKFLIRESYKWDEGPATKEDFFEVASIFGTNKNCCWICVAQCNENCKVVVKRGSLKQKKMKTNENSVNFNVYGYHREYGREHLIDCCSKRKINRCECISYWWIVRFLFRVFDVTLRASILLLSWILLGGAVTFILLVLEGILLFFGTKQHNSFAWLTNIVIFPLNTEERAKKFTEIYVIFRLCSNLILIALFYLFGFVNFDCVADICDPYTLRHGLLTYDNDYSNSFAFILLLYVTIMYYLAIFPLLLLFVATYLVNTDTFRGQDHTIRDLVFVGDWHGIIELIEFGFTSEVHELQTQDCLNILRNGNIAGAYDSLSVLLDHLSGVNMLKGSDISLSIDIIQALHNIQFDIDTSKQLQAASMKIFENTWKLVENDNVRYILGANAMTSSFDDARRLYDLVSVQYETVFSLKYLQRVFTKTVKYYQAINQQRITQTQYLRVITLARLIDYVHKQAQDDSTRFNNVQSLQDLSDKVPDDVTGSVIRLAVHVANFDNIEPFILEFMLFNAHVTGQYLPFEKKIQLLSQPWLISGKPYVTSDSIGSLIRSQNTYLSMPHQILISVNRLHMIKYIHDFLNILSISKSSTPTVFDELTDDMIRDIYDGIWKMIIKWHLEVKDFHKSRLLWDECKKLLINLIKHANGRKSKLIGIESIKNIAAKTLRINEENKCILVAIHIVVSAQSSGCFNPDEINLLHDEIKNLVMKKIDSSSLHQIITVLINNQEINIIHRFFIEDLIDKLKIVINSNGNDSIEAVVQDQSNYFNICCNCILYEKDLCLTKNELDCFINGLDKLFLSGKLAAIAMDSSIDDWNGALSDGINMFNRLCELISSLRAKNENFKHNRQQLEQMGRKFFRHGLLTHSKMITNASVPIAIIPNDTTVQLYQQLRNGCMIIKDLDKITNDLVTSLANLKTSSAHQVTPLLLDIFIMLHVQNLKTIPNQEEILQQLMIHSDSLILILDKMIDSKLSGVLRYVYIYLTSWS